MTSFLFRHSDSGSENPTNQTAAAAASPVTEAEEFGRRILVAGLAGLSLFLLLAFTIHWIQVSNKETIRNKNSFIYYKELLQRGNIFHE